VRLMPAAYVEPYVKRSKNDAADAEAICEGVTRPNMRFVATRTPEQQSCLTLHRTPSGPSYGRFEGTGLQGEWNLSSHRHFSAMVFGGHTSSLNRICRLCRLLVWLFADHPFFRAMSVGSTPASRYRHRQISSVRATATMVMRRMRSLEATDVLAEPGAQRTAGLVT
jgi:hypothetical protein